MTRGELEEEIRIVFRHTAGIQTKDMAKEGLEVHTRAGLDRFIDLVMDAVSEFHTQEVEQAVLEARVDECEMAIGIKGMILVSGQLVKSASWEGGQPDMISASAIEARCSALRAKLTPPEQQEKT